MSRKKIFCKDSHKLSGVRVKPWPGAINPVGCNNESCNESHFTRVLDKAKIIMNINGTALSNFSIYIINDSAVCLRLPDFISDTVF